MSIQVWVGKQHLNQENLIPLLAQYQLLPKLAEAIILDQTMAATEELGVTPEETQVAVNQFVQALQITSETGLQQWLQQNGLSNDQLVAIATRPLRIQKFKQHKWGNNLEAYFVERKAHLDRFIYSLIRTKDPGIAQELYFRILDDGTVFSTLAKQYSQGPEAQTGGLVGPVEVSTPHPQIATILKMLQPGEVKPPLKIGEWFVILRLEKFLPAQLDEVMEQRLINEQFEEWLRQTVRKQLIIQH